MLTSSSNQYLRPEYLTPLPTTLDAKKSPLALLAQTCSQIGADPLPTASSASKSSSLLSSSSSERDVSGGTGSNSVGSSSTPLSSIPSSGSNSSSSNSSNCSGGGQSGGGGGGSKKSKSSHHHLNVGTEHPPSHHGSSHRSSNSSTSISGEGGGGGKKSGKNSGKNHHTLQAHHQSHGTMEKTGGEKDLTSVRLTPPLIIGNNSNSSIGSSSGSSRGKSGTPDEKSRVKTPSSTAVDKNTSGSPSMSSMTSGGTRDSVGREAGNKSPAASSNSAALGGSIVSGGNTIPGSSSTTSTSSSSNSSSGGATAEAILSKSSHDNNHSIPLSSPVFTSTPLSNGTNSTTPSSSSSKLNLNGPLGGLTSAELFSLSSLKSHGNHLPFPSLYPGLSSHSGVVGGSAGSTTAGLPPYLHSYARLKAAAAANGVSGADHLGACGTNGSGAKGGPGTCRDPFCTGCQLGTPHLPSGLSHKSCPAGCMQCDHHSPFFNGCGGGGGGSSGAFPFLPRVPIPPSFYPSALANSSAAAAAAAAASAASSQPYVCNWIVGETYCGKRFSSSDELLQHLRSHTSLSSAAAAAGQSSDPLTSYAHNPFLSIMSMNLNLSRSYPSPSLSPLSSARFHPYSKMSSLGGLGAPPGLGSMPGGPADVAAAAAAAGLSSFQPPPGGFSSLSHPLNPYFSYAAFYGPR